MKAKLNPSGKNAASALLMTVIFIVVLALSIGGYMTYVLQQVRLGGRSQAWNMAMAVSEAGVEEGFEHVNDDGPNGLGNDGWSSAGGGVYYVHRSINGTFAATYTVYVNYSNPAQPSITSSAYVTPPAVARNGVSLPFFYAAATPTGETVATATVGRGIEAVLDRPSLFKAALSAKGNITMSGNNVTVDSFDSGTPGQNVGGQWAASVSGDQGIVASDGGISNTVSAGNANIYGDLYTGPGESNYVGPNGFVGTHNWETAGGSGIEPGHFFDDANFSFPNTSLPPNYSSYTQPQSGDVTTINSTNVSATTNIDVSYLPSGLTNGQTVGPISTNTTDTTVSTYPGPESNLASNFTWVTVGTYPGSEPGLTTNTTAVTGASSVPPAGTYIGTISTNVTGHGHNQVTSYGYSAISGFSYQAWTWTYPTTTYTYTIFSSTLTFATNNYDNVLSGGNYVANSTLTGNTIVTGPTTLVMPNGFSINNLIIAPGGSLLVYSGGSSFSLSGNSVMNEPGLAQNLIIFCAPTVTTGTISCSGNAHMDAVIVAPNANVSLNGGGNSDAGFSGAIMANNISLSGHWEFHYDVALSRLPSPGRYILSSWREIPVAQQ